jgi:hypothetical protein
VLAADTLLAIGSDSNPQWMDAYVNSPADLDPRDLAIYDNCPPHKKGNRPAGANEVFADGSVLWRTAYTGAVKFYRLDSWAGKNGTTEVYFAQEITDFDRTLAGALPSLILK